MPKLEKHYHAKKLIQGNISGIPAGVYVAVPDRGYKDCTIIVDYMGTSMRIRDWNNAVCFRRFHDQFSRNTYYTLGYFKYIPDTIYDD